MIKLPVSGSYAMLGGSFASLTLIAGVVTATGCGNFERPEIGDDGQIIVTELAPPGTMQSEVRVERTPGGDALRIASPGWREITPGVWQSDTAGQLVIDTAQPAAGDRATPLAVSCTISVYNGPFATAPFVLALTGIGAVGFAQARCTGGIARFTVAVQSCTDLGCNAHSFGIEAGPPGTPGPDGFAVEQPGTLGASCSAQTSVTPSGINQFNRFLCD